MNNRIREMTVTALMTAVLCVMGPATVPIGPVPISLTNLALYFILYLLTTKQAVSAYMLYLLAGLMGLPVFSGYSGGPAKLFGPTGGYLIGFIPMAVVIGLYLSRNWQKRVLSVVVFEAATWIPYILGTLWLSYSASMPFGAAFAAGVIPFIMIDLIKITAAAFLGPVLRRRLQSAGLLASAEGA